MAVITESGAPGGGDVVPKGALPESSSLSLVLRLVREHLRPHAWRITFAIALMIIVAATTAATAWLLDPAIKRIFLEKDQTMLWAIPLAVAVVTIVKSIASYGQNVMMNYVGQRIVADTQIRMFAHLMHADLGWLQDNHSGRIISNFLNDAVLLREAVSRSITGIAKDALSLVFLAAVMVYQDWQLSIIALVILPFIAVNVRKLAKRMRKAVSRGMEETGNLSSLLSDNLDGARVVKAYGQERREVDRVTRSIDKRLEFIMKGVRARSAASPMTEAFTGLAIAGAIYYAGWRAMSGAMELNQFVSFLAAMMLAYQPLKSIATLHTALQEGLAAATRTFAVLDVESRIKERSDAKPLAVSAGVIGMKNVSFSYRREVPAIRDVTMEVPAGKTVALVGPSGAGKSTLLNLIPRFYDVEKGAVMVDDQDVRNVTLGSLRQAISIVTQEPFLFDDTIKANIAYGRPGASDEEIFVAARTADAHEFIEAMPEGYETLVGEAGRRLSGGQRQRIAIARAMLKDAPILLLDEATSSLDTESERQVQAALARLKKGRTTLVIAHRLSTVIDADRIYVIDRGQVIESGTHDELIAAGGLYARLYQTQFADTDPVPATAGSD